MGQLPLESFGPRPNARADVSSDATERVDAVQVLAETAADALKDLLLETLGVEGHDGEAHGGSVRRRRSAGESADPRVGGRWPGRCGVLRRSHLAW